MFLACNVKLRHLDASEFKTKPRKHFLNFIIESYTVIKSVQARAQGRNHLLIQKAGNWESVFFFKSPGAKLIDYQIARVVRVSPCEISNTYATPY